jgi:hemolysin III
MAQERKKFSILWFSVQMVAQFALMMLGIRTFLPKVWANQIAAGPVALILVFVATHLVLCFFEWAFHRYVLHSITFRVLSRYARGHRNHHGLTPIRLQPVATGSDRYILNRYPITETEQFEDSAFPVYAMIAFSAVFTPLLAGTQILFPHLPILIGGYGAIAFSMSLYEILHAMEHRPYEWWKSVTEHPRFGGVWRRIYGFHHMHHANILCNEAISGFFGLPVADWAFGTYHQPKALLLEGRMATAKDFAIPPPPGLVRWIDGWARKREARILRHGLPEDQKSKAS